MYSDDLGQILPQVNADRTGYLISNWGQVLGALLAMFAFLGLYQAVRGAGALLWLALLAFVTGSLFFMASNIFDMAVAYEVAPRYVEASEATRPALEVMASTFHQASYAAHTLGHVLGFGIGFALFALASLRTSVGPRWVHWLGLLVVAPIFGWFAILEPYSVVAERILLPGFIALNVWLAVMGVVMLRLREPVASSTGV